MFKPETMQQFANWCRDERDDAARSAELFRTGKMSMGKIENGISTDISQEHLSHLEGVVSRMTELLAKIEDEQGIAPN
jgi:hypothetical protein